MHKEGPMFTNQKIEPIMSAAANMKKENMGALLYFKPAAGLNLLRNQILGKERFDLAFKTYIHRWAYKHPTPDDFSERWRMCPAKIFPGSGGVGFYTTGNWIRQ